MRIRNTVATTLEENRPKVGGCEEGEGRNATSSTTKRP